jgi:fructokinase
MRQVIGVGETILDIIFKGNEPHTAVPGGAVFNSMVSLRRMGVSVAFISETGNDRVGALVREFMHTNGMSTDYMDFFPDGKSPLSLAFLNETNDAEYLFYTDYPSRRLDKAFPVINPDDILVFGSFYALNPLLRERMVELLEYAKARKAILYYDPNFRKTHVHEAIRIRPMVIDNYEYADMVRGSDEDFLNLYGKTDPDQIYADEVRFFCKRLITTHGARGINLYTETLRAHYDVPPITTVSTIGAGDNFNAGLVYGLLKYGIGHHDLPSLSALAWEKIVRCGIDFSSEVCQSYSNYISSEFAAKYGMI